MNNGLQPIQKAMLAILQDERPHTAYELHTCLPDKGSPLRYVQMHISRLRKHVAPGFIIHSSRYQRVTQYQLVPIPYQPQAPGT
jgi:hypothetical protein